MVTAYKLEPSFVDEDGRMRKCWFFHNVLKSRESVVRARICDSSPPRLNPLDGDCAPPSGLRRSIDPHVRFLDDFRPRCNFGLYVLRKVLRRAADDTELERFYARPYVRLIEDAYDFFVV